MSSSYTDARIHFKPDPDNTDESNLLLSIFTNDDKTVIINALDITNFRNYFNDMVEGFDEAGYTVNDMLRFYSRYNRNNAESYTTGGTNNNYLVNQWKEDGDKPYRNILSDFILDMIINYIDITFTNLDLKEAIKDNLGNIARGKTKNQAQNSINNVRNSIREYLRVLINSNLFNLYFSVIGVEIIPDNSDDISLLNVYNTKNIIVMNILKYFYLSELLLRVLLDTNENVNAPEDVIEGEKNKIHSDYEDSTEHLGMRLSDNEITDMNDSYVDNKIDEVNKILKDIYLIYLLFDKNQIKFETYVSQSDYGTGNGSNTDSGSIQIANYNNQTNSLKNDVVDINMNINKLNLKNINIKKNYEKNRNIYFITILFVIVYISINLFVILTKGPDSLLTVNGIIIIVILLTKFSQAIMKVYQNLVKDLKN